MSLTHAFATAFADGADTTKVRPSNWNAEHVITGGNLGALVYQGTDGVASLINSVASGQVLVSGGAAAAPSYSASPTLSALTLTALSTSTLGNLFKGSDRFAHNYASVGSNGQNTFLGVLAGNFTLGHGAGATNLASANTGIGWSSLVALTTGKDNTALGRGSLFNNTEGNFNTAVGVDALLTNTTGINNTAVGIDALFLNVSGVENVGVGANALNACLDSYNTSIGTSSLIANTTGNRNTAVGRAAGGSLTTGAFNTFLGLNSGFNASQKVDAANSMALGASTFTTADNQVVIGDSAVTQVYFGSVASMAAIVNAKALRSVAVTYANRPGTPLEGMLVAITDSNTATWGATIAGGGANHVLAYYNGTNWTVAGA